MNSSQAAQPHPVKALRDDHRRASRLLQLLIEQIDALASVRRPDIELAQSVFRYMVEFVDRQHHAREDFMLELLGKRDPSVRRKVQQAEHDHHRLARESDKILSILADMLARRSLGVAGLIRRIRRYRETLIEHFQYEEAGLFSTAEALLDASDWRQLTRAATVGNDPLFGPEVEAEFRFLFDTYVNQISEIGRPASRPATASAAALTDSASAVVAGSVSVFSELRRGATNIFKANLSGASSLAGSRSVSEFCSNALNWSRANFDETNTASGQLFTAMERTARAAIAPFGKALEVERREFDISHCPDNTAPSLRAHLVNLALRATVKRMASAAAIDDLPIPEKNIEIPPMAVERFIPPLGDDVEVERMELDNAFAEVFSIVGGSVRRTILFLPGGGFMMAPTQAHRLMAARLAREADARVVMVHYRLAPEYRFPAGLDDCVDAYRALLDRGTPAHSIVLVGDSAGGAMALSSSVRIRDEGLPSPCAAVLLSPVTDLSYSGHSRRANSWTDPSLPPDERNFIAQVYLGEIPQEDPLASPLFSNLAGLPPILIQVGSIEMLLDDALRVAAKIRAQGGECECEVWHDMPHDWVLFGMLPEARKALQRIVNFIEEKSDGSFAPRSLVAS